MIETGSAVIVDFVTSAVVPATKATSARSVMSVPSSFPVMIEVSTVVDAVSVAV